MRLLPKLPKSTVCLQCGHRGFPETLVACATCRLYAVHRYCLPNLRPNFRDPVTWFCEDCRPGDYAILSSPLKTVTRETVDDRSEKMLGFEGKETTGDRFETMLSLVPYTGDRPEKITVPNPEVTAVHRSENRLVKMLVPKREEIAGHGTEKMLAPKLEDTTGQRSEKRLAIEPCTGDESAAAIRLLDNAVEKGSTLLKQETAANDNDVILPEQNAVTQLTTDDCSDRKLVAEQQEKASDLSEKKRSLPPARRGVKRLRQETVTSGNEALPEKKTVIQETKGNEKNALPWRKTVSQGTACNSSNKDGRSGKKLPLVARPIAASLPEKKTVIQETTTVTQETTEQTEDSRARKKLPLVPRPTAASLPEKKTVIRETGNDKNVLPSRKTVTDVTRDDRTNKKPFPGREATTDGRSGKKLPLVPRKTVSNETTDDSSSKKPAPEGKDTTDGRSGKMLPLIPYPTEAFQTLNDVVSIGRKRSRTETTTDDNDVLLPAKKAVTEETTDDISKKKPTPQREEPTGGKSDKTMALVPKATVVSRPMEDAVWRGSLKVVNKGRDGALVGGFRLFLSTTACDRVREEAKALTPAGSIRLEMVPRRGLWPESFGKLGPARSEIGLFLLANEGEGDGEGLVREMVRQDLAMRGAAWRTEEAELLVFTSAVLPADLWMIDGKFYLWGVFRGRRKEEAAGVREATSTSSCLLRSGRDDWIGSVHCKKMKKKGEEKGNTEKSKEKVSKNMKKQGKKRVVAKKMRLVCRPSCIMHINEHLLNQGCLNDQKERQALINVAGFGFLLLIKHDDPSPKNVKEVFNFFNGQQKFLVPEDYFRQLYGLNFGSELMDPKGKFTDVPRARFKAKMEQLGIDVSKEYRAKIEHVECMLLGKKKIHNYDWVKLYIFYALGVFIAPRISKVIPGYYWSYLEQISQIKRYNWAKLMADDLNDEVLLTLDKVQSSLLVKMGGNTCALVEYFKRHNLRSKPRVQNDSVPIVSAGTNVTKYNWSNLPLSELYKIHFDLIHQRKVLETSIVTVQKIIEERKVFEKQSEEVNEAKTASTDDEDEKCEKISDESEDVEQEVGQEEKAEK